MNEPRWITPEVLRLIHIRQLELFGGSPGVIDENVIESALHKAQNLNAYEPESDVIYTRPYRYSRPMAGDNFNAGRKIRGL